MDGARISEHCLVILRLTDGRHPDIVLLKNGSGWALPRIRSEERRSADVAELNRTARDALGLEVSVLRCLADEPGDDARPRRHVYLLEAHGPEVAPPPHGAWVASSALGTGEPTAPGSLGTDESVVRCALALRPHWSAARGGAVTSDWSRPGWRDEALAWVAGELALRGLPPVREIEQIKVWEFSQLLRLATDAGPLYLKARPADGATKAPLTHRLSRRHPAWTPAVVAVNPAHRWLLMRATPGESLMNTADPGLWERAAAAIAHMQIDWLTDTGELTDLGCPRVTVRQVEQDIAPLLGDTAALQPRWPTAPAREADIAIGDNARAIPDGLTDEELVALRRRRPELEALCRELAAEGVPESLEHGDLWAENAIASPQGIVFLDWEDATVAHPFFTLSLFLLSLHYTDALAHVPDARRRLRDAYLGPWSQRGPLARWPAVRLERTFELAQPVAMLHYARQFWRLSLPLIETSWEVRTFAPLFLRRLLHS